MNKFNKKILIVEDEEIYRTKVGKILSDEGFAVIEAPDGKQAFDLAQKEKPDLIFMDIMLPDTDGISLSKKIKEQDLSMPIIFLTNLRDVDHISKAMEVAISDYLLKSDLSDKEIVNLAKRNLNIK